VLHREIPFLRIGLPLCAGIVCGYFYLPDALFFIISGTIIIAAFILSRSLNRNFTNTAYGFSLTFAMFIAGLLLYTIEKTSLSTLDPLETIFSGFLSDYPEEKENTFRLILRMESGVVNGYPVPLEGSILLYHKKESAVREYLPGDRLIIRCKPLEITNRGNPFEFDYRFYMENQGIRYYAFTDSSDISGFSTPERRRLTHRALMIREKIIDMFRERGISGDRLALVAAITVGQKNMLDLEQKQYFIKAGVMHIMAVSGLHAVILSVFIFNILFFLKGRLEILRIVIALLLLWSFAFVTGLTPSVMRATIMFTFIQAGKMMKRPVNQINSVLASALMLVLARPSVIFDAGFLLSYSAVIFIICYYHDFYLKIRFRYRIPDLIWQSAVVSVVAQAGTLPLTVMLFNRFPTWFILSNIIIVPLSSIVIITGSLVPLTFPLTFISQPLARILDFLAGLTEYLTARAASLPFSTIENIGLTTTGCIFLSISLFLSMRLMLVKKSISLKWLLISIMGFTTAGTLSEIRVRSSSEIVVYNSIGSSTIGIRTGKVLNLYSDAPAPGPEVIRHCAILGLKSIHHSISEKPCLIKAGHNTALVTSRVDFEMLVKYDPDILIFTGSKPFMEQINEPVEDIKAVVVASGADPGNRFSGLIRSINADTVHFTVKTGAFSLKL
jgi:competence protein ComEC